MKNKVQKYSCKLCKSEVQENRALFRCTNLDCKHSACFEQAIAGYPDFVEKVVYGRDAKVIFDGVEVEELDG